MNKKKLERIARREGVDRTGGRSVVFIDHEEIRKNFSKFSTSLPRVQPYFAVKANNLPEIVETIYNEGGSFDVASYPEFLMVNRLVRDKSSQERRDFIWNKVICANPVKDESTLRKLDRYSPLVTFDAFDEINKIKKYAPHAGLVVRIKTSNVGSVCDLSCKFGEDPKKAVDLIEEALSLGLDVEGISFHVGSQCTVFDNYTQALALARAVFDEAEQRGCKKLGDFSRGTRKRIVDIGGGFPVSYDQTEAGFDELAMILNQEIDRLFPEQEGFEIIAEPGRFMVASAATLVARIIGVKNVEDKMTYTINDGVYHTFSGQLFDHINYPIHAFKKGELQVTQVNGHTCDGLDIITRNAMLPKLERGDLVYSENIGAYSNASATYFNGFPPAKIVHLNLNRKKTD